MLIGAFDLVTILVLFPVVLACFYYWFLAIYAFYGKEKRNAIKDESIHSFAIIIPAHNEESVITETLKSCAQIDYPSNKFQVFVIADNCTDNTAEIARNIGAKLVVVTGEKDSRITKFADISIVLSAGCKEKERKQLAPLGTLFEASAWILLDSIIAELMKNKGETEESMQSRHATLE